MTAELDPNRKDPHTAGAKLDAGKNRLGLVISGFARALRAVGEVGTYGANKYTDDGWKSVPNGLARYTDAMYRHLLAEAAGEERDPDTQLLHAAHAAWNALARLDKLIHDAEAQDIVDAAIWKKFGGPARKTLLPPVGDVGEVVMVGGDPVTRKRFDEVYPPAIVADRRLQFDPESFPIGPSMRLERLMPPPVDPWTEDLPPDSLNGEAMAT